MLIYTPATVPLNMVFFPDFGSCFYINIYVISTGFFMDCNCKLDGGEVIIICKECALNLELQKLYMQRLVLYTFFRFEMHAAEDQFLEIVLCLVVF